MAALHKCTTEPTFIRYKSRESQSAFCEDDFPPPKVSWLMKELKAILSVLSSIYTFIAFSFACCFTPWLVALYVVVRICRNFFVSWLETKFKGLEFVKRTTARTAVDTKRNQGIITVLLKINGSCQLQLIKNRIQEDVIDKKQDGKLVHPHMKMALTSKWGNYAWIKGSDKEFNLNNHIFTVSPLYKGRSVSDANIQEYLSSMVAKMLPREYPPWQITLLPCLPNKTYLMIRLHHLYLSEDQLTLGSLLLIQPEEGWENITESSENTQHVLAGVFHPPVVIPQMWYNAVGYFKETWNSVVSKYDPLENPVILETDITLGRYVMIYIISIVSAINQYIDNSDLSFLHLLDVEVSKRRTAKELVIQYKPGHFGVLYYAKMLLIGIGKLMLGMTRLIRVALKIDDPPKSFIQTVISLVQETFYLFKICYTAPRVLFEEIFLPEYPCNVHQLQTLSLCGRKVVSWSEPVPVELIKQIRQATGASTSEIIMSAMTASLRQFFEHAGYEIPDAVMTTCHFMPQEHLLLCTSHSSGMLCLPLPTKEPNNDPLSSLRALQTSLYNARSKQAALYLASKYQLDYGLFTTIFPTLFAKACLYLLSRRYTVTVTQIDSTARYSPNKTRKLLWGQDIEKVMYWRPPQANVCLSLTLISYGDGIKLGVMADAQLSPNHTVISDSFATQIHELASRAGISYHFE